MVFENEDLCNASTLKLYMPLTADIFSYSDCTRPETQGIRFNTPDLCFYRKRIICALTQYFYTVETMRRHPRCGEARNKLRSLSFTVEQLKGQLWGVAVCQIEEALTPEELSTLKAEITQQVSNGWGRDFSRLALPTCDGEMFVHLWNADESWFIQTAQELFSLKTAEGLPEKCYAVLTDSGELILLQRGQMGYSLSKHSTRDRASNAKRADELNKLLGVTAYQRQAMVTGSQMDWDIPEANPAYLMTRSGDRMLHTISQ